MVKIAVSYSSFATETADLPHRLKLGGTRKSLWLVSLTSNQATRVART